MRKAREALIAALLSVRKRNVICLWRCQMYPRLAYRRSRERAVTMVEVMVAMVLVTLALGDIFAMTAHGLNTLRCSRQVAAGSRVLQQRIEMIRARPWPEISNAEALAILARKATESEEELANAGFVEKIAVSVPPAPGTVGPATGTFSVLRQRGTVRIVNDGDLGSERLLLVEVTVSWQNVRGEQQRQLRTLVCRTGLTRSGIFGSEFGHPIAP
jgi:hypothetical protein